MVALGRGHLAGRTHIAVVAALLVCAPLRPAGAKPVGTFDFLVVGEGDQTDPSIDGQYVVYAGPGEDGSIDVLLFNTIGGRIQVLAGGPGDQRSPDLDGGTIIWRAESEEPDRAGIWIQFWQTGMNLRHPPAGGDGQVAGPTTGNGVAAWETGNPGSRDIRLMRLDSGEEYTLTAPGGGPPVGDQHAPSAFGGLVAYVDEADGGAVWLHDSGHETYARVCEGRAASVALGVDDDVTLVAVARSSSTPGFDDDIEVLALDGTPLAALPVPGVQRNPHLAGEWVAFEDVSTRYSQVILWNWKTDLLFVPQPSATDQTLNDLAFAAPEEVRVVFEDSFSPATGRDIALYRLDVWPKILFDDLPNGYPFELPPAEPASCDDPPGGASELAVLHLGREEGKPLASEVLFQATPPAGASHMPVLVCLDARRVSSAWVTLDDEAIARPSDFEPSVVHLEALGRVEGGSGRISGIIAGKPGAALDVRVLADPARLQPTSPAKGAELAEPAASAPAAKLGGGGCGSAGAAGASGLLALGLVLGRRRLRRDRRR